MTLIANTRMYATTPASKAAWKRLFEWVLARARLDAALHAHEPPRLLSELWERDDLGAVMMCGLPLSRRPVTPLILAQPLPSPPRYAGRATYCSDLVVAADAPYRTLADTFGQRAGYTLKDSQSGYMAFRHHLLVHHPQVAEPYPHDRIVGGLMNARGVIDAIAEGRIDIGPLDGYVHDLLRHTDPDFTAQVRILESTEPTPIPPIVATAALSPLQLQSLREAFAAAVDAPELAADRDTLLLAGFRVPDSSEFDLLRSRAERVEAAPDWP